MRFEVTKLSYREPNRLCTGQMGNKLVGMSVSVRRSERIVLIFDQLTACVPIGDHLEELQFAANDPMLNDSNKLCIWKHLPRLRRTCDGSAGI